jgi:hypothetical protein
MNLKESELSGIIEEQRDKKFKQCFGKFEILYKLNLSEFREFFFNKRGYAFLDFKGNFSKIFLIN